MVEFVTGEITSRKNDLIKYAASLLTPKGRKREGAYRFDGVKLFSEAVACGVDIVTVILRSEGSEHVLSELDRRCHGWREELSARIIKVKESAFEAISEENAPEGVICIAKYLDKSEKSGKIIRRENFSEKNSFNNAQKRIMAAESVRDPGNLGTLIRTCKGLGVDELWLSADCADILSPKVIRSSMGAVFALSIRTCDSLVDSLLELKREKYRILATALHGEAVPLSRTKLGRNDVFVIGNEGHGLSGEMLSVADACVYIDMYSGPGCESLNAGVAAAICAWEQKRQTGCDR